jgi:serine/threonine-protein kinase HipA
VNIPVWYEALRVGTIAPGPDGPVFRYDTSWLRLNDAFPVSMRMPLGSDPIPPTVLHPWLQNLLPERGVLTTMGRILGSAPEDVLGLLQHIGRDTAGALAIGGEPADNAVSDHRDIPDQAALERIIEELPAKPFLVGEEGVSMSLAGAQDKLPVAVHDGRITIPIHGAPSTHILKPDNRRLAGSVQNEALCMALAQRMFPARTEVIGPLDTYALNTMPLNATRRVEHPSVAPVTTGVAGARSYLLVARYDRVQHGERWQRIHQEDFCQALGKPPGAKYQHNQTGAPGPSLRDFFELTRTFMMGADTLRLLDAVIFNVLIGNVDAHAKNYSLIINPRRVSLAPLYDLMCGAAWESITLNHAQSIGGQRRGMQIRRRHWMRMAEECGLNATSVVRRVTRLADAVLHELDVAIDTVRAMPAGDHPILTVARDEIRKLCVTVRRNAERDDASA